VAGSRDLSGGFISDRDYLTEGASSESRILTGLGTMGILIAGDDRAFGAAGFYGNYNSWERTKGWFGSATQELNSHLEAAVAYRRHSNIFLLQRDQPLGYKNQHIDNSFEAVVRDRREIAKDTTLLWGFEENTDQIRSTNLGNHGRNRGAGYAQAQWRLASHASISAGLREELFGGGRWVSSPMIAGTLWLPRSLKLHGVAGYGFRIPTYLDLYYKDPATVPQLSFKASCSQDPSPAAVSLPSPVPSGQRNSRRRRDGIRRMGTSDLSRDIPGWLETPEIC
jgi:vitamin B12 transporter